MADVLDDTPDLAVRMEADTYERIQALMSHIQELNEGSEIGAWLTGEWADTTVTVDGVLIPEQTVSRSEVDIDGDSIRSLLKEYDPEVTNRIVGHWHIHPFGTGEEDWSGQDETKIGRFMQPNKQRHKFLFVLSSYDWMKARVEARMQTSHPWTDEQAGKRVCMDGIQVQRVRDDREAILEDLRQEINEKVTQHGEQARNASASSQTDDRDLDLDEVSADKDPRFTSNLSPQELEAACEACDYSLEQVGGLDDLDSLLGHYQQNTLEDAINWMEQTSYLPMETGDDGYDPSASDECELDSQEVSRLARRVCFDKSDGVEGRADLKAALASHDVTGINEAINFCKAKSWIYVWGQ